MGRFCFDPPLIGLSSGMQRVVSMISRASATDSTVLVTGESGTGKEVVVRNIHRLSARASKPLVILNALEVPDTLLQSELFGYARGTFTGAVRDREGLVEKANGGTFFLDEIGDMPPSLQASLLRTVQEREVRRMGEGARRRIDVRFVFATNRNLESLVRKGNFRADLFYRINVIRIKIPPLRERREDIPVLAEYFLREIGAEMGRRTQRFSADALRMLTAYDWPGNVRELRNEVERILVMNDDPDQATLSTDLLSAKVTNGFAGVGEGLDETLSLHEGSSTLHEAVRKLEVKAIKSALRRFQGNKSRAAGSLGITRQGLLKKMKRYRIVVERLDEEIQAVDENLFDLR